MDSKENRFYYGKNSSKFQCFIFHFVLFFGFKNCKYIMPKMFSQSSVWSVPPPCIKQHKGMMKGTRQPPPRTPPHSSLEAFPGWNGCAFSRSAFQGPPFLSPFLPLGQKKVLSSNILAGISSVWPDFDVWKSLPHQPFCRI